jgi:sulfide dehydrogenase cytochrome subunit
MMIDKTPKYALILVSGLMLNSTAWATRDGGSVTMLVGNCIACHGPEGSSLGPATPTISGSDDETFLETMKGYKNDERPSSIMGRIAKGYDEADFEQMAKYFSKQPFVRQKQKFVPEQAQRGQEYHDKYCHKCHEENGYVDEDGSAILAGQWMPYLQFSLTDFHAGTREMSKKMKKRLKKMVKREGEGSLNDIVHFYGSQDRNNINRHDDNDDHSSDRDHHRD